MEVKDKILKVAKGEFARLGFRNVRTDELAQKIGISKRTLYENFPSKEQLFEEVVDLEMKRLKELIDEILTRIENTPEVNLIEELRKMWQVDVDSTIGFTKEFFSDLQKFTPHIWEKISRFRQREMESNFSRIYTIGVKQGLFRGDLNVDILFLMHITIVQQILNPEVLLRLDYSPQEVVDSIYNVMFRGVLTEEAQDKYGSNIREFCITNNFKCQ